MSNDIDWKAAYQNAIQQATLAFSEKLRLEAELMRLRAQHPDVRPSFHTTTEPGPCAEDPKDGYPHDE